ncbi:MAG: hypothetical protein VB056_14265 [Sphaerochaeta associata]|uniref:hypothetical protein n=1 Tax=Sphaerochaeta associata TaxID=1129264 RepID=UPI002B1FA929|nr:hypothetical protein [Sphaerochaeta associata]MEA5030039.1 hypothetical protein [Sphaerochaeta associata]
MDYQTTKERCIAFDKSYQEVERFAIEWGMAATHVRSVIDEIFALATEVKGLRSLASNNASAFIVSELFQNPEHIQQLSDQRRSTLTGDAMHVLQHWIENPWFWCYYQVKEEIAHDFWKIQDLLTGKQHLYYSPYIRDLQDRAQRKDICCFNPLFSNGTCLQYSRTIKAFLFPVSDFHYFCNTIAPNQSLKEIQSKHYPTFLLLDLLMGSPIKMHAGLEIGFIWQSCAIPNFSIGRLQGVWEGKAICSIEQYALSQFDESMINLPNAELFITAPDAMRGSLFWNSRTAEAGLHTNSKEAYSLYAELLQRAYPGLKLPKEPEIFISQPLQRIISERNLARPWKAFELVSNIWGWANTKSINPLGIPDEGEELDAY